MGEASQRLNSSPSLSSLQYARIRSPGDPFAIAQLFPRGIRPHSASFPCSHNSTFFTTISLPRQFHNTTTLARVLPPWRLLQSCRSCKRRTAIECRPCTLLPRPLAKSAHTGPRMVDVPAEDAPILHPTQQPTARDTKHTSRDHHHPRTPLAQSHRSERMLSPSRTLPHPDNMQ